MDVHLRGFHSSDIWTKEASRYRQYRPRGPVNEVHETLKEAGLESCELIVGVDFTKSNEWSGRKTFSGKCLHDVECSVNPYMVGFSLIALSLHGCDSDNLIPCYGFGDYSTGKDKVFSFFPENVPARGLNSLLERYKQIAPLLDMYGPTSFAPLICQAMKDVYNSGMKFHILLILADGQISDECLEETKKAIVDACAFPLSIVVIGVGDGPWDAMQHFDTELPERTWDNFHFFDFNSVFNWSPFSSEARELEFKENILAEVPEQYKHACALLGENNAEQVSRLVNAIPSHILIEPPVHLD